MAQTKLSSNCIGVVGLGLIGGSIALDLKNQGLQIHGVTHQAATAQRAKERGLAQLISTDHAILSDCDLVILALPLSKLLKPDQALINALPPSAVITDVGSVKAPILKIWNKIHPRFVGSHPMAGTTEIGVEAGQRNLFSEKAWVATPNQNTDQAALEVVHQLALTLNSQWIKTEAEIHDQAVALISHLPLIISAALLQAVGNEKDSSLLELAKSLSSSGFADTTRVGGGNPDLGTGIMSNNRKAVLEALTSYRSSLEIFEKAIFDQNWEELHNSLELCQSIRPDFLKNY